MNAMKNLIHAAILACWGVLGALFTFKLLLAATAFSALTTAGMYWLWFAGLAAGTSYVLTRFKHPASAVATHVGALIIMGLIPKVFPLSILRMGLDLLVGG